MKIFTCLRVFLCESLAIASRRGIWREWINNEDTVSHDWPSVWFPWEDPSLFQHFLRDPKYSLMITVFTVFLIPSILERLCAVDATWAQNNRAHTRKHNSSLKISRWIIDLQTFWVPETSDWTPLKLSPKKFPTPSANPETSSKNPTERRLRNVYFDRTSYTIIHTTDLLKQGREQEVDRERLSFWKNGETGEGTEVSR